MAVHMQAQAVVNYALPIISPIQPPKPIITTLFHVSEEA